MADRSLPPALGLALAVLAVSFAAPLFRLADAPALTASFWRLAFAVLLLLPFTASSWAHWRAFTRHEWALVAASGIALGLHFGLWVTSLFLTTVAASVTLVTLQAVFVALGGHFLLADRLNRRAWTGVALATAGALLIGGGPLMEQGLDASRRALLGDALALAGGIGSAAYMLIGRRLRRVHGLVTYVAPVYGVAALTVLAGLLLFRQPLGTGLGAEAFVFFVLLAAVPMLGGHTLANWCLRHLEAHVVATWILLEPVGAALIAWALPAIGERPEVWTLLGAPLVLMGAALTVRAGRPDPALAA